MTASGKVPAEAQVCLTPIVQIDFLTCFLHVRITPTAPPTPNVQDLQESEGCQDELALRVQQLKAELVLFKGLMSNVRRRPAEKHAPVVGFFFLI